MPWQQHWMLVTGEMIQDPETGFWVPAYPEAFATMMRQNGKTLWVLAAQLQRATVWEAYDRKPQALAYSGQTGLMARQKFRKEHWPMIRHSEMRAAVERPRFDAGDTGLDFRNGSILTIWGSSEDAGHSLTVDQVAMDEIWADVDDRREQAALPAMATRHDRQKILASTGGTEKSTLYLRKQDAGRSAVTEGRTEGMAYLEYAFDRKDDPEDPETWRRNMPALGYTITERTVQAALDEMRGPDGDLSEFCRAWGNVTKRTGGERVIPESMWVRVCEKGVSPAGRLVLPVDATPDLGAASVVVVDDQLTAELVEHRPGVSWLLGRVEELAVRYDAEVALDVAGPVGYLAAQLEQRNVRVARMGAQDVKHACAAFMDRLADARLRVRPHRDLNAAVEVAIRQSVGDGWKWARTSTDVTISPLVALTLGVGRQLQSPRRRSAYDDNDLMVL